MAKKNTKKQKLSAKQMKEREAAALERKKRQDEKKARTEKLKRIGIAIVCIIFALALSIPTMALTVLSGS